MEITEQTLSDIIVHSKYAKYLPKKKKRENWGEIVERTKKMHIKRYPHLKKEITCAFELVNEKKNLPSMRSLQFAGLPIERNNSRIYNCSYRHANEPSFFPELMFLLLGGSGVGYSVQNHHINQLPAICRPGKQRKFVISDAIEGWADAIKVLCKAFFYGKSLPRFVFDEIRPKGSPLKTAGGKAPGPDPLRVCLTRMLGVFESKPIGTHLTSAEVSDLACFVADAVLSGGIRRAAMICLFDADDNEMLAYKSGKWWENKPYRGRTNISAVMVRNETTKEQYDILWDIIKSNNTGEPGIFWTNDKEMGSNPCGEVSLKNKQFCNLTTVNFTSVSSQDDLEQRVKAASLIGTLQSGYIDFHYLSNGWSDTAEGESLLGISVTGLADGNCYKGYDWAKCAKLAIEVNEKYATEVGVDPASRLTCIKPEGTSSLVVGSSSGIHPRHSLYYLRRIRYKKNEPIAQYLSAFHTGLLEKDNANPTQVILAVPIKAPERSVYRSESPVDLLERIKFFQTNWVHPGHKDGANSHNISATVSIKPGQWDEVGKWMWENREFYNGITVLPYDLGTYEQPPYEEITKQIYCDLTLGLKQINIDNVKETEDNTDLQGEQACAGGYCEIK